MAEERSLTPERELLKLIEEPGATGKGPSTKRGLKFFNLFSPVALKARLSFLKAKFKGGLKPQSLINLEFRVVNRVLEFGIFLLLFYLVSNLVTSFVNLNRKSDLALKIKKSAASSELPEVSLLKAASYYLEKARARDIFKMGLATSTVEAQDSSAAPVSRIAEASKKLKLVGISWSKDPDAIIEDTKAEKAYFLKRGQVVDDFEVKAIFKDKVILSYQGEEIELR